MADTKDAAASITNWSLIASAISAILAANGVMVDAATVTAILSMLTGFFGRWKAGGIGSVFGVSIPQPKGEQP